MIQIRMWQLINCVVSRIKIIVKATSYSTIFDIPMHPLREDEKRQSFYPLKKARNSRDGHYSFEFCPLPAALA